VKIQEDVKRKEESYSTLQKDFDKYKNLYTNRVEAQKTLHASWNLQKNSVDSLARAHTALKKATTAASEEKALTTEMENLKASRENQQKEWSFREEELKNQIRNLKQENEELKNHETQLKVPLAELEERNETLKTLVSELKTKLIDQEKELSVKLEEINTQKQVAAVKDKALQQLTQEMEALKGLREAGQEQEISKSDKLEPQPDSDIIQEQNAETRLPASQATGEMGNEGPDTQNQPLVFMAQLTNKYKEEKQKDLLQISQLQNDIQEKQRENDRLQKKENDLAAKVTELEQKMKREQDFSEGSADSTLNVEYLKNCVIRYIGTTDASEKERLLRVVSQLLHCSPDEVDELRRKQESQSGGVLGWASSSLKGFYGV